VKGVTFQTPHGSFNSMDWNFVHAGFIELQRVALDPVSVKIPGGAPLYFPAQEGDKDLQLSFAYVGQLYRSDVGKFVSRLYNSRSPMRVIIPEEDDRFYVGIVTEAPTVSRSERIGTVDVTLRLVRNYALRRWTDEEINESNTDINLEMPIVPGDTSFTLSGSTTELPYYNDGIDLPPVLEVNGVDFLQISVGGKLAQYVEPIEEPVTIDFANMKATNRRGEDLSVNLVGDQITIPHGDHPIRLFYQKAEDVIVQADHERKSQFDEGTGTNVNITESDEDGGKVQTIARLGPSLARASVGYNENGEQVGNNEPRLFTGKFNKALLVEQSVTQLFNAADFSSFTGWNAVSGLTLTGDYMGAAQIIRASAANGTQRVYLRQDVAVSAGETLTVQIMQRKVGTVDFSELRISWYNGGTFISRDTKDITAQLTNDFKLFSLTATAPANTTQAQIYMVYDGAAQRQNLELEAIMPMCTKSGYTWGWHASGTKPAEVLTIPDASILNAAEGSLGVWVYEDGTSRTGYVWDTDGTNRFSLYRDGTVNRYIPVINGANPFGTSGVAAPAVGWHYWEVRWQGTTFELYLDGTLATLSGGGNASITLGSAVAFTGVTTMYVGCKNDQTSQWNSLIDDFQVCNKLRTQEAGDLYDPNSGDRPPIDYKTAYTLRFDRALSSSASEDQVSLVLVAESGGRYESSNVSISTDRDVRNALMTWRQTTGGSVTFYTRLYTNGSWGDWQPLSYNGHINGIDSDTDLNGAKIKYRVDFHCYDVTTPVALTAVSVSLSSERSASVTVKNRKRFG
jgi:hypothetical protein